MAASLFEDYVAGGAKAFFASSFLRADDRKRVVERSVRPLAPHVLAGLRAQNARFGASAARAAHLDQLERGAAVVVTGQQAGLFLGPLYTLYKAASAIRVARELAAESRKPVVPVFWLQTEDHDLVEIAHCHVLHPRRDPLRLQLPAASDNRVSIAHLRLPEQITDCVAALASALEGLPHAREHVARLARNYRAGASWSEAFAGVLAELFEPEGLLLIDPRDPSFTREAAAIHERAIAATDELGGALQDQCLRLQAAGFEATVHVRSDAPLSFFHAGGPSAARHRLAVHGSAFMEIGTERKHERGALLAELAREPLSFSTSALLRPILQDTLLPTAAYVGGPAEVAYFAQLPPLYAAFGLEMPLIVPRARLCVIEAGTGRLLTRLGLERDALVRSAETVLRELSARNAGAAGALSAADFEQNLVQGFERALTDALAEVGPHADHLGNAAAKTRDKLRLTASKLSERYAAQLAHADESRVQDIQRLKHILSPHGQPQERVYGYSYFGACYGDRTFVEAVLSIIEAFEPRPKELRL